MTTIIKNLCQNLQNASSIEDVKDLLYNTSLIIRNLFYRTAKSISTDLPYGNKPLADKIIKATTCVGLTNKKIVCWNIDSLRAGIVDKETSKCTKTKRIIEPDSPMGQLIQQVNPDIICLQETKLGGVQLKNITYKLAPYFRVHVVPAHWSGVGWSGGNMVLVRKNINTVHLPYLPPTPKMADFAYVIMVIIF